MRRRRFAQSHSQKAPPQPHTLPTLYNSRSRCRYYHLKGRSYKLWSNAMRLRYSYICPTHEGNSPGLLEP